MAAARFPSGRLSRRSSPSSSGLPPRLPAWVPVAARSLRTAVTAGALTALAGLGALSAVAEPATRPAEGTSTMSGVDLATGPLQALMDANRCSFTGFGPDVIPASAIVRTPQGESLLVSFDDGWAVFTGEAAGTLIAVCRGPLAPPVG